MKYSENYNLALPSRDDNDIADINEISDNFETLDNIINTIDKKTNISVVTYNNVVNKKILFDDINGNSGTITFSENCEKYDYLEIFYCDNGLKRGGYTKIYPPYDALITLQLQEPGTDTYLRQSLYTVTSNSLIPDLGKCGYALVNINNSCTVNMGTNYIKITRVVGIRNDPVFNLPFNSNIGLNNYDNILNRIQYDDKYLISYYNAEYGGYLIEDAERTANIVNVPWLDGTTYLEGTAVSFSHWSTGEGYTLYICNDETNSGRMICAVVKDGTKDTWLAQGTPNDRIIIYKRD